MKKKFSIEVMAEIAIFAAIGWIFDYLGGTYSKAIWPNGGTVGIALIAIYVMAYRRGTLAGVATGLIMAVLDLLDGFYAISSEWYNVFLQIGLDYLFAAPLVGLSGFFGKAIREASSNKKASLFITLGCLFGGTLKFICHFLSGVIYWGDISDGGSWLYSLTYNGPYTLISVVLCIIILIILNIKAPFILCGKKEEEK